MKVLAVVSLTLSVFLLSLNIMGSFKPLRPSNLNAEVMRFGEIDVTLTAEQLQQALERQPEESDAEYSRRLTLALAQGIAHVEWENYDPDLFHQRVPPWENYILYLMGVFSGIPEFERYHFSNPYRSIERGIGICGDVSMTLSSLLNEQSISNTIVTVPGHVMVQADIGGQSLLLDADFGVVLPQGIEFYQEEPQTLALEYQRQLGRYNDGELMISNNLRNHGFRHWNGAKHFITKKYYFEKFAYFMKWAFPLALLMFAGFVYVKSKKAKVG